MLRSMTGYGKAEKDFENFRVKIELKSVNHRYSDITVKMPRHLSFMEELIKSEIRKHLRRGKIEVYISAEYINATSNVIKIDFALAESYSAALKELCERLMIDDKIKLGNILGLPEIVRVEREVIDEDQTISCMREVLSMALAEIMEMKKREGAYLQKSIEECLDLIQERIELIEKLSGNLPQIYKEKLKARIDQLLIDEKIRPDAERIALEVAILADKSDITEELVRLKSHNVQFRGLIQKEDNVGKKLEFLVQEMNREINTVGSKTNDICILNDVVEMKSQLEKIREQIQNVE